MKLVANKDIIKYAFWSEKGYTVVQIAECEFISKIKPHCKELYSKYLPNYFRSNRGSLSFSNICEDIKSNKLFGAVEVDIEVNRSYTELFQEYPPFL